jgi:condensin complex subunit 3
LDDIIPEDDEEEVEPKKKGTRKRLVIPLTYFYLTLLENMFCRRSGSLGTETTASSAAEDFSPANSVASSKQRNSKGKSKAK